MKINENFLALKDSYLFATVAKKTKEFQVAHPEKNVIRLSIGDVTLPLPQASIDAMHGAVEALAHKETFKGYGPDFGYETLVNAIRTSYARKGVELSYPEVFVSDGAKSDCGNILDIFSQDNVVLVPDPVYPVYLDTNIMDGRKIIFANATKENGFLPMPQKDLKADIIYLCSPNNPTGAAYSKAQLKEWVDYAKAQDAIILYDAAYEFFVQDSEIARSIYQIEGAKDCAIEICSFSKTAGFTGVRCGYTVVPETLERGGVLLNKLWARRQSTKFNGVSYVTQMGAAAVFSEEGEKQIAQNLAYYRENAKTIATCLDGLGIWYTGGKHSPYVWLKCPNGMTSWEFFDYLLENANVVGTPGSGFGANGEGFFRLTAFGTHESTAEACRRIQALLSKRG